ncbi:hypothetical protein HJC23_013214 [Cyclotella cryptica]|uniref:3'-5' exonuclease domain-containing protein n=1 Tax=Cyclotella cryptica TaxID=29204 RepID=A0ABD3QEP9_9STRA|eukprot:CCRYP_006666-RB/>CCRYP_006666-RB protein AED:0.03 eAED:0.03 QI:513/1/1/1/0/0/3/2039/817
MKVLPSTNINKLLRKASSSRDPTALPTLLTTHQYTLSDLECPSSDGKNALHMACWMGHIDNVSLLLQLGCDINRVSVGKHNYGKSPIFYAVTRGREDVVRYLLQYYNAESEGARDEDQRVNVRIVNNKGQSLYSLAYSHDFSEDILECIRNREREQKDRVWIDYSTTHSDGCTYGDLDLRFLRRPLTDEDVVKDGIVVNPTTKESRRGNFARNNPSVANGAPSGEDVKKDGVIKKEKKGPRKKEKKTHTKQLSSEQLVHLEELWNGVTTSLQQGESWDLFSSLLAIVQFWEGTNVYSPWVEDTAARLDWLIHFEEARVDMFPLISGIDREAAENSNCVTNANLKLVLSEASVYCGSGDRHATLVKRILVKTIAGPCSASDERRREMNESLSSTQSDQLALFWNDVDVAMRNQIPQEILFSLIKPIILWDGRTNSNWMHDFAKQLHVNLESNSLSLTDVVMKEVLQYCEGSRNRHAVLLKRLLKRSKENILNESLCGTPKSDCTTRAPVMKSNKMLPNRYNSFIKSLQNEAVNGNHSNNLPKWNILMNPYLSSKAENHHLSLPKAPFFIDSSFELNRLGSKLRELHESFSSFDDDNRNEETISFNQLVAFDSEFCTADDGSTELATIQLSVLDDGIPFAWVVDLFPGKGRDLASIETVSDEEGSSYYSMTCSMLRWLFLESGSHIVGFAPHHDLSLLSSYLGEEISVESSTSKIWDVQLLAAFQMAEDAGRGVDEGKRSVMSSLPGLKSCCSYFLTDSVSSGSSLGSTIGKDSPSWSLSKREQCSNWRQRPLSVDQLEYAGLDAAVLLVLLSELIRRS